MQKQIFLFAVFFITGLNLYSQQKTEIFRLQLPNNPVENSLYNTIHLIDLREDTTDFGTLQKGLFNTLTQVVAEPPILEQLINLMDVAVDSTVKDGQLLLLLRQINFAEVSKAFNEIGYFEFRASLFAQEKEEYYKIVKIDTVITVKALDVTKKLYQEGSGMVTNFIVNHLNQRPIENISFSENQLLRVDSIEKDDLPLYTASTLTDGIYNNYHSFAQQQPDRESFSTKANKKGDIRYIYYKEEGANQIKIKSKSIYAFVKEGKPYIATKKGYYPLEKKDDDFYFIGKRKDFESSDVAMAGLFFGLVGAFLAQLPTAMFEMKIDHLTGKFIFIKR